MPRLVVHGLVVLLIVLPGVSRAASAVADVFDEVPRTVAPSGVLLDRVVPFGEVRVLDGGADAPIVDRWRWRQAYSELRRAGAEALDPWKHDREASTTENGVVPVAILDHAVEYIHDDARWGNGLERQGERVRVDVSAVASARVFTAAALVERVFDRRVTFDLGSEWTFGDRRVKFDFDAGDGRGWRPIPADGKVVVDYATTGRRTLAVRTHEDDPRIARFTFEVVALAVPAPEDTIRVTSSVAFEGVFASGDAFVYLAPGRSAIEAPIVFVEGLDLDDSLGRDELYTLLNGENLLEDFRAEGYDVVVLDFDDATTYVQANGLLVAELVQEIQSRIAPTVSFTLAGASMGGVCSRYALAWMEAQQIEHRVELLIAFDSPHRGANIPLGLQLWVDFFRGESVEADFLASRLDRPAARQLLVYHYRALGSAALADPLRAVLEADLTALGGYPVQPRRVAVANGSGGGIGQAFAPGAQLLRWESSSFTIGVTGNVWAVGNGPSTRIFEGQIRVFFVPISGSEISVANTLAYDGAPGGTRASLQQAADVDAPYGDIEALHSAHGFIPTVSALDLTGVGLFDAVSAIEDPASSSPFDAVYAPGDNQEHVLLTAENAAWIRAEVFETATSTPHMPESGVRLLPARPNPFNPSTTLAYEVDRAGPVRVAVYDLRGRHVQTLVDEPVDAGRHTVVWHGRDARGNAVSSGVYLARLDQGARAALGRLVLVK